MFGVCLTKGRGTTDDSGDKTCDDTGGVMINKKTTGSFNTKRLADKSGGKSKGNEDDVVIMENKNHKTNKTMIFTQKNLFFCVKKKKKNLKSMTKYFSMLFEHTANIQYDQHSCS